MPSVDGLRDGWKLSDRIDRMNALGNGPMRGSKKANFGIRRWEQSHKMTKLLGPAIEDSSRLQIVFVRAGWLNASKVRGWIGDFKRAVAPERFGIIDANERSVVATRGVPTIQEAGMAQVPPRSVNLNE